MEYTTKFAARRALERLTGFNAMLTNKWRAFRHSLAGIITLIVAALLVPLSGLLVAAMLWVSASNLEAQRTALFFTAGAVATGVDAQIDSYAVLANALAASPSLLSDDLSAFDAEARRVTARSQYPNVWVVVSDLDGRQLVNTRVPRGQPLPVRNALGRESALRAIASGRPEVSDVILGPVIGKWTATVDLVVTKDGAPFRVISIVTTLGEFAELLNTQDTPPGWLTGILDRQGKFVARVPRNDENVGRAGSAGFRASMQREGVTEFPSLEGDPLVNASVRSGQSGWTVGIGVKKDVLYAASRRALQWGGGLAVLIILLSLALTYALARRIVDTMARLRDQARALIDGRPAEFHSQVPEIAEMWESLKTAIAARNTATGQRQIAQHAQRNSENRLQLALDAARLGLWQYDTGEGTVAWDARFKEIFDVADEKAHLDVIIQRLLPEEIPRVRSALEAALAPIDPVPYFVQYRIRRSDGAIRWIEAHGAVDFEGTGETRRAVRLVGTVADITESKQQQERTLYLMREVDHRGKNIMSVVQSIARLTATSGRADFAARFADRMQALAASQDVIINSNWQNVDIGQLVRSQLAHFSDLIGRRIAIGGEPLNISPAAAQTLGMALHELATNASKYGALSNANGRITIGWRVISAAGGDTFEIDWKKHDGPVVVAPTGHGFGTTVVETMTKSGLSASVRLEYPATGLEWHLACPIDRVRAGLSDVSRRMKNIGADPINS